MCYLLFSSFPCGHTKETGTEQCELWQGTLNCCPKPAAKTTRETKLCYVCSIEADALKLGSKDIDNLAEALLDELDDQSNNKENIGAEGQAAMAEGLRRVADLYSRKLFNAENQLQIMKESVAEKSFRSTSSRASPNILKSTSLSSLRHKIERFNTYWRGQVKLHESQLEKAGRNHNTWLLAKIQGKLDKAHERWERQIEDIFEGAEDALE
jgi:hypothetical protein